MNSDINRSSSTPGDDVIAAARAWADIVGEREFTDEEHQCFVDWVQDADHARELGLALEIRFRLAQVPESLREALRRRIAAPVAPEHPRYLSKRTGPIWRPAVAAAVALLAVGAILAVLSHRPHYSTGTGERSATFLADGSRVELSAETDLEWLGGTCDRRVRLNRGEALFEVHSDPRCPFQVLVDRVAIEVLGTRFDVVLHRDGPEQVSVLEGRVRVHGLTANQPWQLDVGAGQQAVWGDGPPSIRPFQSAATTAWQDRRHFEGVPLAQVVEELQRHTSIPIRIADPRLLTVPINADLQVDERHIRASVLWLGELPPIQVRDDGQSFTLTYRAQASGEHPR